MAIFTPYNISSISSKKYIVGVTKKTQRIDSGHLGRRRGGFFIVHHRRAAHHHMVRVSYKLVLRTCVQVYMVPVAMSEWGGGGGGMGSLSGGGKISTERER